MCYNDKQENRDFLGKFASRDPFPQSKKSEKRRFYVKNAMLGQKNSIFLRRIVLYCKKVYYREENMKKQGIAWLLVLCMALGLFSLAMPAAAAQTEDTDYASLYVKEGLTLLYLAYEDDTVDLAAGKWNATFGGKAATLAGDGWRTTGGGVGYDLTADAWAAISGMDGAKNCPIGIELDMTDLPADNYTVEFVVKQTGLTNADGTAYINKDSGQKWGVHTRGYNPYAFGPLKAAGFICGSDKAAYPNATSNALRWLYTDKANYAAVGMAATLGDKGMIQDAPAVYTLQMKNSTVYTLYCNGSSPSTMSTDKVKAANGGKTVLPAEGDFHLMVGYPGTAYSVRVYNRVLSTAEMAQNHFADIAAYYQLDLTEYFKADKATRQAVHDTFASASMGQSRESILSMLQNCLGGDPIDLSDSLYVTDGLTVFLNAMGSMRDTVSLSGGAGYWTNAIDGKPINFTGSTWFTGENGGVGYRLTQKQYGSGMSGGIILDPSRIPEGDYSLEMVLAVEGLVDENGDRYHDRSSNYGTYHSYGIAVGPWKSLSFITLRDDDDTSGILENRWFYLKNGGWSAPYPTVRASDAFFWNEDPQTVMAYDIYHQRKNTDKGYASLYTVFGDGKRLGVANIGAADYVAPAETEGYFYLMYNFPCTYYAVRVYNRTLSDAERYQNHAADLVAFYGLDDTFLQITRAILGDSEELYAPLAALDFRSDKATVQAQMDTLLESVWVTYVGTAARLDGQVGIRATFSVKEDTTRALEAKGYTVEYGILCGDAGQSMAECAHRLVAYTTADGKNAAAFIDEENFAMAVQYTACGREEYLRAFAFYGYMTVRDADGKVVYELSCPAASEKMEQTVFSNYLYQVENNYGTNTFMNQIVNSCYEKLPFFVELDGNDATADGSMEKPYATVSAAYAAICKLLTQEADPKQVLLMLGEGVHRVSETLTFDFAAYAGAGHRLSIIGSSAEETTLTGNRALDALDFEPAGSGVYRYQFDKDADGAYPEFRFLYVNGKIATMAHGGKLRAVNGGQYITQYARAYNPKTGELDNTAPKMYLDAELFRGLTQEDLKTLELHIEVQWKFNILPVERVDWEDTCEKDGVELVAVYFPADLYKRMAGPANEKYVNRPYWIENAKSLLDEKGEYFYDREKGTLYYYPEDGVDMANATFEVPTLENLIVLQNAKHVQISGITFTGVDHLFANRNGYCAGQAGTETQYGILTYAAVYGKNVKDFEISDCVFESIGGDAINLRGDLQQISIRSNRFFNIGATGIRMGIYSVNKWSDANRIIDLTVEDNYLDGIAWYLRESVAIQISQVKDARIEYNTIKNCAYTAISAGVQAGAAGFTYEDDVYNLHNVSISYNYITDFMTDMRDGGAIYTLGGNAESAYMDYINTIQNNFIVWSDITGDIQGKSHTSGLYNDNSSSHWYDVGNVQVLNPNRYWKGMYFHYVQADAVCNILIDDNYYLNCTEPKDEMFGVIYRNINGTKGIFESNTHYYAPSETPDNFVYDVVEEAGSSYCKPSLGGLD